MQKNIKHYMGHEKDQIFQIFFPFRLALPLKKLDGSGKITWANLICVCGCFNVLFLDQERHV